MSLNFTQKEKGLLEDQKSHEQLCVEKYTNYSNEAKDPQLKQLLYNHATIEQQHLNTINKLLSGEIPNLSNQQGSTQNTNAPQSNVAAGMTKVPDSEICKDMLMTEKYVSRGYDTAIFEFKDTNVRDILNHIQKEEQKHGEAIYKYMESRGMYNVQ